MAESTIAYATIQQFKERLKIPTTVTDQDGMMETILVASSRWLDNELHRRFYATTETRLFTALDSRTVLIDELTTITSLKTDDDGDRTYETTWATTDYRLLPVNAVVDNAPFNRIETDYFNGANSFPTHPHAVEVVGSWGYTIVPPAIVEATLRIAQRQLKLTDAPLGVAGSEETGFLRIAPFDRDVEMLIWPYRNRWGIA